MSEIIDNGLKPIAIDYLYVGMENKEDIFNYDGTLLLLAKGNVLSEAQIMQLKNFNDSQRNISVFENTHKELLEHGVSAIKGISQAFLEEKTGYAEIKDESEDLLGIIQKTNSVPSDASLSIAGNVNSKLNDIDPSLIFQCINAPKPINEYLRRHSVNVAFLNGLIGKWLNLSAEKILELTIAGLLHDVGKTQIPTEILDSPNRLTISEFEIMKMHTIYSFELIESNDQFPDTIKYTARHHHEKVNGNGYPDGMVGDEISLYARITAISDIYDAMISKRSYKDAFSPFTVISEMAGKSYSELDTHIMKIFIERMPMELLGKPVHLSDGSIGTITYVFPNDLNNPLVEVNGKVVKTNDKLHCDRMVMDL